MAAMVCDAHRVRKVGGEGASEGRRQKGSSSDLCLRCSLELGELIYRHGGAIGSRGCGVVAVYTCPFCCWICSWVRVS